MRRILFLLCLFAVASTLAPALSLGAGEFPTTAPPVVAPAAPPAPMPGEEPPGGTSKSASDLFETKGGYVHPFLWVTEYYNDNVLNTSTDKKSDFLTVITPGIWLGFPRVKENLPEIATETVSPGGLVLGRFPKRFPGRFQTYALYRAEIERYRDNSELNNTTHTVEAMAQYNFRGGLSIDVEDQFKKSHDVLGAGAVFKLNKFTSNLATGMLNYELGDRFVVRLDYSNFLLNYDGTENDFRDRTDNSVAGYVFYKLRPRLALFGQYQFIDIAYDKNTILDSREHLFYGGIRWDITDKTKGSIKAGYAIKDFKDSSMGDSRNFVFEAQGSYYLGARSSLNLTVARRTQESDLVTARYIRSDSIGLAYNHRFTAKITGSFTLAYVRDSYRGTYTFDGVTKEPKDSNYNATLAFQYNPMEWLKFDAGYIWTKRTSNFSVLDYTNNTIYVRVMGIL